MTFGSKLLSSISKSEIYSFLKYLYATERHGQAGDVEKTQFSLDHLGVTHFLTLCDPSLGRHPYLGITGIREDNLDNHIEVLKVFSKLLFTLKLAVDFRAGQCLHAKSSESFKNARQSGLKTGTEQNILLP